MGSENASLSDGVKFQVLGLGRDLLSRHSECCGVRCLSANLPRSAETADTTALIVSTR